MKNFLQLFNKKNLEQVEADPENFPDEFMLQDNDGIDQTKCNLKTQVVTGGNAVNFFGNIGAIHIHNGPETHGGNDDDS